MRDEQGHLTHVPGESLTNHMQRLDTVRRLLLDAFRGMPLDEFRRPRHLEQYDVTPQWVLHHLIQHEAQHRGQILDLRTEAERILLLRQFGFFLRRAASSMMTKLPDWLK